jgi:hypothetical protein
LYWLPLRKAKAKEKPSFEEDSYLVPEEIEYITTQQNRRSSNSMRIIT